MDSPEIENFDETETSVDPVSIDSTVKNNRNSTLFSSSVPNTRSHNFLIDSSEKSDDSSSMMTGSTSSYNDEEDDDDEEDEAHIMNTYTYQKQKRNYSVPEPIIYTSKSNSTDNSNPSISASPTAVYATMLNANNIVNNSMNILQAGPRLPNPPTLIEFSGLKFLIMDAPSRSNLHLYLKEMERARVNHVVRICEPTYPKETVESSGIKVHDWVFPDGESPPSHIIDAWMSLVDAQKESNSPESSAAIAVHCVAGLGRAPVLVAIALIENGMRPLDAVMFIRQRRRGAINNKQLKFLENYRPRHSKKDKCVIM